MSDRLRTALNLATEQELEVLCGILGCPTVLASRPTLVEERLDIFMGKHFAGGRDNETYPYAKLCRRVAQALGEPVYTSDFETELRVVEHFARRFDAGLAAEGRASVLEILEMHERETKTNVAKVFAAGGLVALLQSGGFDAYISASTLLSAGAGVFGITVPFSGYVALSSAIAHLIGPAAWAALGVKAFSSLKKANDVKLAPLVLWTFFVHTRMSAHVPM